MNCNESIEFLPWFLNGTLAKGEHDEIRRHLATCEACRAALKETREAWEIFDQHLPSETLVTLAYGEVPQGIDPALAERHLSSCPQCAAELELARMSRHLEEDGKVTVFPGPKSLKTEAARDGGSRTWRAAALAASFTGLVAASGWFYEFQQAGIYKQLAQNPAPVQAPRSLPPAGAPAPSVRPDPGASAAQIAGMQKQLDEARQQLQQDQTTLEKTTQQVAELRRSALEPQLNAQVVTVQEVVRDGSGTEGQGNVLLGGQPALLPLPAKSTGAVRNVEILDGGGKAVWTGSGLRGDRDLEYKISFPAGFFKPGHYAIRLLDPKSGELRETYALNVK